MMYWVYVIYTSVYLFLKAAVMCVTYVPSLFSYLRTYVYVLWLLRRYYLFMYLNNVSQSFKLFS